MSTGASVPRWLVERKDCPAATGVSESDCAVLDHSSISGSGADRSTGGGSTAFHVRFEREVRTTSSLNHPNIVTVYGCDTIDGQPLLLMEYVDGVPLDRWISDFGLRIADCEAADGKFSRDSQRSVRQVSPTHLRCVANRVE